MAICAASSQFFVDCAKTSMTFNMTMTSRHPLNLNFSCDEFFSHRQEASDSSGAKLEPPQQHENDNDDQDGADDTDAAVTEAVTVPAELAAEAAEQEDDEDDNEDGSERHDFSPKFLNSKGVADHSRMLFILCNAETRNREYVNDLSSAGFSIGGAIAAVRAVTRDFIGMIARVSGVTVRTLHTAILDALVTAIWDLHITAIQNCHVVITAPKIRQAAITNNAHDIRGPG
jgi:hypothetical protein